MRKISLLANRAFYNGYDFNLSNTQVKNENGCTYLYLFNNLIARKTPTKVEFNMQGYNTVTTKERLNAIGAGLSTRKGVVYSHGREIDCYAWNTIYEV